MTSGYRRRNQSRHARHHRAKYEHGPPTTGKWADTRTGSAGPLIGLQGADEDVIEYARPAST